MKILVMCTYPVTIPRHGGQLRVRNIVDSYRDAGHDVEVVGVLGSEQYESEIGFLPFPKTSALVSVVENPFLMEDYAIGRLFSEVDQFYILLSSLIKVEPDIIHVEQPWLFAFAKKFIETNRFKAKILYGSQNIEWHLKHAILSSYIDIATTQKYTELIKQVELDAINGADRIICVSENDADWIKQQTQTPVILAPNGVSPWSSSEVGSKEAKVITGFNRYALYCASAHPPNISGFFEMFSGGFGSLKPDEKLIIAGSAGWSIAGDVRVHKSAKLAEKVTISGVVNQPCLSGLIEGAHCIVLPLTQGGGTNLKTAEALWSGKHIVATKIAMRGFEKFIGSQGVRIANDSGEFKRELRAAMNDSVLELTDEEKERRKVVLWSSCLKPLIELINEIEIGISVVKEVSA